MCYLNFCNFTTHLTFLSTHSIFIIKSKYKNQYIEQLFNVVSVQILCDQYWSVESMVTFKYVSTFQTIANTIWSVSLKLESKWKFLLWSLHSTFNRVIVDDNALYAFIYNACGKTITVKITVKIKQLINL